MPPSAHKNGRRSASLPIAPRRVLLGGRGSASPQKNGHRLPSGAPTASAKADPTQLDPPRRVGVLAHHPRSNGAEAVGEYVHPTSTVPRAAAGKRQTLAELRELQRLAFATFSFPLGPG